MNLSRALRSKKKATKKKEMRSEMRSTKKSTKKGMKGMKVATKRKMMMQWTSKLEATKRKMTMP